MVKHLSPDTRKHLVEAVRRGNNKSLVARVFGVCRRTVGEWCRRAFHRGSESFRDRRGESKPRKITSEVERAILAMRVVFEWGTGRIRQGLASLPKFAEEAIEKIISSSLPKISLSRTDINNIQKKHEISGYPVRQDNWKFFRAQKPDELWQLDLKGPFTVGGEKFYIVVCIDDYSRFLVLCELLKKCPTTDEITSILSSYIRRTGRKPQKILTDRGAQFQVQWREWCSAKERGIEPLFAHPYYPQDKGKVERAIRNIADEFVKLLKKFPEWLGRLGEYAAWYNHKRLHMGIKDYPVKLYQSGQI
jgi:hypothetical protein